MPTTDTPARRRRISSVHVRALLSLGIVLGIGSVGTMASFSDSATANTGSFTAGTLDLKLNNDANTNGTGANQTAAVTSLSLSNLVPGESVAAAFPVLNNGSVGFSYTATATATGALATALKFTTTLGGSASNATSTSGVRTGTCSGTAASSNQTLSSSSTTVIGTAQTLASGASQTVCVQVSLPSGVDNSQQGNTASASYVFNAAQLS